jgi:glycerol-3-phosphate acyltransferase PlsY
LGSLYEEKRVITLLWLGTAYILGAVPFGLIIAKGMCKVDIRSGGSGNIGATNVARMCGAKYGVMALALDMLKGLIPVLLAGAADFSPFFVGLIGLSALLGHMYSAFLSGQGGKGVATTIGVFTGLSFFPTLLAVIACVAAIKFSGFVSMGSLLLVAVLPVTMLLFGEVTYAFFACIALVLVFWKHRDNIHRLAKGEEKPWRKSKHSAAQNMEQAGA